MYLTLENIIVQLFIALTLFFLLRWTIGRLYQRAKYKTMVALTVSIVLTPFLYLGLIQLFMFAITYEPKKEFNQEAWLKDDRKRYYMAADIINSKLLVGKDTTEVKQLLGVPTISRGPSDWGYNMGEGSGGLGFMFHFLLLKVENGKVAAVKHERWQD